MAKKNINDRCPFSAECERKVCEEIGRELDCDYYRNNAIHGYEIEDQEARRAQEDKDSMRAWEESLLEDGDGRSIELITAEILFFKEQAGGAIIEIGRRLLEAKEKLSHGEWLPWLAENVDISEGHAQRFMRLAKEYPNPSPVTDLGVSKALALLALPASEREGFAGEKHEVNGEEKTAFEMSRRELEEAIRERNEARARAERAERELTEQLEELQTIYDTDMDGMRGELIEAEEQYDELSREAASLKRELEELRSRPVEVAVETVVDTEAVKKAAQEAKAEAEAALAKKLQAAEKAKEAAEKAKAKAEQALRDADRASKTAEERRVAEVERLREEKQKLEKQLRTAGSSEVAVFKVHFTALQQEAEAMGTIITRLRSAGDGENADKLTSALRAMLEKALEAAGK